MTTFSATASPNGTFISLAVADVSAASILSITREPSPGSIAVRGTPLELAAAGAIVLTDLEFPYGEEVTYTAVLRDPATNATLETLTATAGPVLLPSQGMMVSDPISNVQVLTIAQDQTDETSNFRGVRYDLAGRSVPMYVTEEHGGWQWTLTLITLNADDRATLDELLRHRRPVLLRPAAGCDLRDGWVQPQGISVARLSVPGSEKRRRWFIDVAEIAAPDSSVEGVAVTLQDLHEYEPTTLQALADRDPSTLLELALAVINDAG